MHLLGPFLDSFEGNKDSFHLLQWPFFGKKPKFRPVGNTVLYLKLPVLLLQDCHLSLHLVRSSFGHTLPKCNYTR
jgi:hypothetical protein